MDEERGRGGMSEERKKYPWDIEGLPRNIGFFLFIFNTVSACLALVSMGQLTLISIGLKIEEPASVLMTLSLVIVACGFSTLVWWRASIYRFTPTILGWKRKAILEAFIAIGGAVGQHRMGHNIPLIFLFDGVCFWFISILPVIKLYSDYGVSDMLWNSAMTAATNKEHIGLWMGNILIYLPLIFLRAYFNYKNNGKGGGNGRGGGGNGQGGGGRNVEVEMSTEGVAATGLGVVEMGREGVAHGNWHGDGGNARGGGNEQGGGGGNGHGGDGNGQGAIWVRNEHGGGGNVGASGRKKDKRGGHNEHGHGNSHQGGNGERSQSGTYHGTDIRRIGRSNSIP